jgi:hypothetical protein
MGIHTFCRTREEHTPLARTKRCASLFSLGVCAALAGCVADAPSYGEVVTMKAGETSSVSGYPPPGTVWRLDARDLQALSPAPIVDPPPPPQLPPPPRPNDPPYYGPSWYGPSFYLAPSFYYWRRW